MSAVIISEKGEFLCFWKGETPHIGDIIWVGGEDKLVSVDTVVRPVLIEASTAFPTQMIRIIVHDLTDEMEEGTLVNILKQTQAQGY